MLTHFRVVWIRRSRKCLAQLFQRCVHAHHFFITAEENHVIVLFVFYYLTDIILASQNVLYMWSHITCAQGSMTIGPNYKIPTPQQCKQAIMCFHSVVMVCFAVLSVWDTHIFIDSQRCWGCFSLFTNEKHMFSWIIQITMDLDPH